ncbi:hypothetical protein FO519_005663 [Halicephalobus sp. NKZ332]|nr:hypothetical protein FO519_005663 [Halicephalobus sp. NKZ332]
MADEEVPTFRRPKKKQIQTRMKLDAEDVEEDISGHIEDIKEVQKVRERKHGLNAVECAVGKDLAKVFEELDENPFNLRGGGMLKLNPTQKAALTATEIEHDIKEQFKKETLLRDEHEEMKKYVEERLSGTPNDPSSSAPEKKKFKAQSLEDEILFRAAEKLKEFTSTKNDELLSNQMLVGIPEVDLGLEARMNNIVETEQKKLELLKKKNIPTKGSIPEVDLEDPAIKKLRR